MGPSILDRILHRQTIRVPEILPCDRCPHGVVCCSNGTEITRDEAEAIVLEFGPYAIDCITPKDAAYRFGIDWEYTDSVWVTALTRDQKHCILLDPDTHKCGAHGKSCYPVNCQVFPYHDGLVPSIRPAMNADLCPEVICTKSR